MLNRMTLHHILEMYGINPAKVRLVRHSDKEINVVDTFRNKRDQLFEYTSWQIKGKFKDAKYLAVFGPARGTTALFLGLCRVRGCVENKNLTQEHRDSLLRYGLPKEWLDFSCRYDLELVSEMSDLSERLVIDWGKSTQQWVQKKDKNIVQIKPVNSIGEFVSYDSLRLSYAEVQCLAQDSDSNASWVNALSGVNGIYLVRYKVDGRLYVGSAYGKGGILGRWSSYSHTGHAGNKRLKNLDHSQFEFSILEICPNTMSADDVITRENRWKECLGTRQFGLNEN